MLTPLRANLGFAAVVCGLAIPTMINFGAVPQLPAVIAGAGAGLLALAAAFLLNTPVGWPLALISQLAMVAMGLLVGVMFLVGGIFAVLTIVMYVLGRRLEEQRKPE